MKYKYTIKIHTVIDYSDLEKIMNDYGTKGYRVVKAEFVGDVFESGRPMKKFVVYLEKKINK
jgi:hypothetical protein